MPSTPHINETTALQSTTHVNGQVDVRGVYISPLPSAGSHSVQSSHVHTAPRKISSPKRRKRSDRELDETRELIPAVIYHLYPSRFWIIFVYSWVSFNQSLVWLTFSPIADSAKSYYQISTSSIDLLLNWGPIFFIPFLPIASYIARYPSGLRWCMIYSVVVTTLCTVLRLIPVWAGDTTNAIYYLHVAQILNASAGPFVMATPTRVSTQWFGINERATATAIGVLSNNFGAAISFVLGPSLVNYPHDIPTLLYVHCIGSVVTFIAILSYFPSQPPTYPSEAALQLQQQMDEGTGATFFTGILDLMRDWNFVLLVISGGTIQGIWNTWSGSLDQLLSPLGYSSSQAGWMGFACTIASIVGGLILGKLADFGPFQHRIRLILGVGSVIGIACLIWFSLSLSTWWSDRSMVPSSFASVALSLTLVGFTLIGVNPLYYELATEITYPVPEATSAGVLTLFNSAASIIFLFVAPLCSTETLNMIWLFSAIGCTLMLLFIHPIYRRRAVDEDHEISQKHHHYHHSQHHSQHVIIAEPEQVSIMHGMVRDEDDPIPSSSPPNHTYLHWTTPTHQ